MESMNSTTMEDTGGQATTVLIEAVHEQPVTPDTAAVPDSIPVTPEMPAAPTSRTPLLPVEKAMRRAQIIHEKRVHWSAKRLRVADACARYTDISAALHTQKIAERYEPHHYKDRR